MKTQQVLAFGLNVKIEVLSKFTHSKLLPNIPKNLHLCYKKKIIKKNNNLNNLTELTQTKSLFIMNRFYFICS